MRTLITAMLSGLLAGCASQLSPEAFAPIEISDRLASTPAHAVVLRTTSDTAIRQAYFDGAFGQVHYWEAGIGAPLLLFHQAGSSCEELAGLAPYLASDHRLICFDWPGHGMSDDPPRELLVNDYTGVAVQLLDHLDIKKAHILGNHGGALIAMNFGWKHSERTDRIILSGTSGLKDMQAVQEFSNSLGLDERNRTDRAGNSLSGAWDRFTNYLPNSEPGEVLRAYLNNVTVRLRPYDSHYGVLRFDRRPAMLAIKDKPILLMQGLQDPFVSDQETLLEILPNARRVAIDDAGVYAFIEAPEAHAVEIRSFLARD